LATPAKGDYFVFISFSRTAFTECNLFSLWSNIADCGPSITSSVISWPL